MELTVALLLSISDIEVDSGEDGKPHYIMKAQHPRSTTHILRPRSHRVVVKMVGGRMPDFEKLLTDDPTSEDLSCRKRKLLTTTNTDHMNMKFPPRDSIERVDIKHFESAFSSLTRSPCAAREVCRRSTIVSNNSKKLSLDWGGIHIVFTGNLCIFLSLFE